MKRSNLHLKTKDVLLKRIGKFEDHHYTFTPKKRLRQDIVVFIDRDGVVNEEVHLLKKVAEFRLLPRVAAAIRQLNEAKVPVIIFSNQTVVARGLADEAEIDRVHNYMVDGLQKKGARVDGIFYCPHSPKADRKEYRLDCSWRKPKAGMLQKAVELLGGKRRVFVIGDMARDVLAGQAIGAVTILVKTGHAGEDRFYTARPDVVAEDLFDASSKILQRI